MSRDNVEIIRRGFAAVGGGDLDTMESFLAPGFEYVPSGAFVGVRETSSGIAGFRRFLESFWEEFDEPSIELQELRDAGDEVVTWARFRGRGKQSGAETSLDLWIVFTVREGKLIRGRAFEGSEEALEAAGLSG